DASSGFWQILLDSKSSYLCTFTTPFGRYRFPRMPFGICSASEVFQRAMTQIFDGVDGVAIMLDDILVHGSTKEEHDMRLNRVLERCREVNLKLNEQKCKFFHEEVSYLGHIISKEGLKIGDSHVS